MIRYELTGKSAEAWDCVFSTLTNVIVEGISAMADHDDVARKETDECVRSIAQLTKGFVQAKIDRPSLENEKLVAETITLFEDAKLKRAQVESQQLKNQSDKWIYL